MIKAIITNEKKIFASKTDIKKLPYTAKILYGTEKRFLRGSFLNIPIISAVTIYFPEGVSEDKIKETLETEIHGYQEELKRELAKW